MPQLCSQRPICKYTCGTHSDAHEHWPVHLRPKSIADGDTGEEAVSPRGGGGVHSRNMHEEIATALQTLYKMLGAALAHRGGWFRVWEALQFGKSALNSCQVCMLDLLDVSAAMSRLSSEWWTGGWRIASTSVLQRLEPLMSSYPSQAGLVAVSELFFTHDSIAEHFTHGHHRGQPLESLLVDLNKKVVHASDFVLDVVRFHGKMRSLRNKRLYCLKEHEKLIGRPVSVRVRIWPLFAHAVRLDDSSQALVFNKFFDANTTRDDGRSVSVRCRSNSPKKRDVSRGRHRMTSALRSFRHSSLSENQDGQRDGYERECVAEGLSKVDHRPNDDRCQPILQEEGTPDNIDSVIVDPLQVHDPWAQFRTRSQEFIESDDCTVETTSPMTSTGRCRSRNIEVLDKPNQIPLRKGTAEDGGATVRVWGSVAPQVTAQHDLATTSSHTSFKGQIEIENAIKAAVERMTADAVSMTTSKTSTAPTKGLGGPSRSDAKRQKKAAGLWAAVQMVRGRTKRTDKTAEAKKQVSFTAIRSEIERHAQVVVDGLKRNVSSRDDAYDFRRRSVEIAEASAKARFSSPSRAPDTWKKEYDMRRSSEFDSRSWSSISFCSLDSLDWQGCYDSARRSVAMAMEVAEHRQAMMTNDHKVEYGQNYGFNFLWEPLNTSFSIKFPSVSAIVRQWPPRSNARPILPTWRWYARERFATIWRNL